MARTTKGPATKRRKKKLFKQSKGYCRGRNNRLKLAKETVMRALRYAYRDRRQRKRQMRALWIARISASVRELGVSYSRFMEGLTKADVQLNRKMLAHLAVADADTFAKIVDVSKENRADANRAAA